MRGYGIFISWERHTRSRSLAKALDVSLFEIVFSGNRFKRYFFSIIKTIRLIKKENPSVVIIQNPSIVLASIVLLFFSSERKIVIDAHNAAIYPFEGRYGILNRFAWFLLRKGDLVITTNEALKDKLFEIGAKPMTVSDPMPILPKFIRSDVKKIRNPEVVLICTWAPDEPYLEFLEAVESLSHECVEIKITGRPPKYIQARSVPPNLKLTGFVSETEYWEILRDAAVIVDLTTRENCLVCGAYEAAAVGVPCVISDSYALRSTFTRGYVYVENKASEIAKGILFSLERQEQLREDISEFRRSYGELVRQKTDALKAELGI